MKVAFTCIIFLLSFASCTETESLVIEVPTIDSVPEVEDEVVVIDIDSADLLLEETDVSDNIIKNQRFGAVSPGMPISELKNLFNSEQLKDSFMMAEGDTMPTIFVLSEEEGQKPLFMIHPEGIDNPYIGMIYLLDETYTSISGLKIGSTMKSLKASGDIVSVTSGNIGIMVYLEEMPETAFVLPHQQEMDYDFNEIDPSLIDDTASVFAVYSYIILSEEEEEIP